MSTYPPTHGPQPPGPIPLQTGLPTRQRRLLTTFNLYQRKHGIPPTLREATDLLGWSSISLTRYHLEKLVARGLLVHCPGKSHAYRIPYTMEKDTTP